MPKPRAGKKLTAKESAFVDHLLADPKRNQTRAAIIAGYSENSAKEIGYENLTKPHIQQAIDEKTRPILDRLNLDAEWVYKSFLQVAQRCMQEEHFDQAGANRAIENIAKLNGMFTERLQLDASVNSTHNIEMVKVIESDSHSLDALRLMMRRTPEAAPMVLDQ